MTDDMTDVVTCFEYIGFAKMRFEEITEKEYDIYSANSENQMTRYG